MKAVIVLFLLSAVALSLAKPHHDGDGHDHSAHSRGCIYALGKCVRQCEEGTHAYTTGCGRLLPEATCEVPEPVQEPHIICDFSACYCDPPTVRNKDGKCVPLSECHAKA